MTEYTRGNPTDLRKVFLSMPREEQMAAMYDMLGSTRKDFTEALKALIDDLDDLKTDLRDYREKRERQEQEHETLTTNDKINAFFLKRFAFWVDLAARVLSNVLTALVLALLALATGVIKIP